MRSYDPSRQGRSRSRLKFLTQLVDSTSHNPSKIIKMSSGKVKAAQLWGKNKDELTKQLGELKSELGQLRVQKVASSGTKLTKIRHKEKILFWVVKVPQVPWNGKLTAVIRYSHDLRKSIARVLTIINAKQRAQLRLFYKNKKYAPLDLRPKQTRAIRRRLSPEDKARVLEKTKKRSTHFPQRKFAVKA
ncbi:60S ribosomal protein L35 [Paramyrothecium foliicola]|nr:60S ribosomal protein L35 [Paramyrothecium foliicola]